MTLPKPERQIGRPDWLDEDSAFVLSLLNKEGGEALLVGGCVRNHLLRLPVTDMDIATTLKPDEVMKRAAKANIKAIGTGLDHGTVTLVYKGRTYEVTTLRKDVKTDGRHALVAFGTNWHEDAQRRDFTINALYMNATGGLYDPTGQGLVDLDQKQVRFIGDAQERIKEDALRMYRFFRFSSLVSPAFLDPEGLDACRTLVDLLANLSGERITQETLKLLSLRHPVTALREMKDAGFFKGLWSDQLDNLLHLIEQQERFQAFDLAARLALTFNENGPLILSNELTERWAIIKKASAEPLKTEHDIMRSLYFYDRDITLQRLFIQQAAEENIAVARTAERPVFPIGGADLLQQGLAPGPEIGKRLAAAEDVWINSHFTLGREALLQSALAFDRE